MRTSTLVPTSLAIESYVCIIANCIPCVRMYLIVYYSYVERNREGHSLVFFTVVYYSTNISSSSAIMLSFCIGHAKYHDIFASDRQGGG